MEDKQGMSSLENSCTTSQHPSDDSTIPMSIIDEDRGIETGPMMTTMTMMGQSVNHSKGIDIHQALSILASRVECSENHHHDDHHHHHGKEGIPEFAKSMGQTIDLYQPTPTTTTASTTDSKEDSKATPPTKRSEEEQQQQQHLLQVEERKKRLLLIEKELKAMSDKELLQAVLQVQEDRVATYREYERGLLIVLQTGNMTSYPDTCSKATASFSVLSDTMKAIHEILQTDRSRKDLASLVTQLQGHEKEKLQLTAAYHLERVRQSSHYQLVVDEEGGGGGTEEEIRIQNLLQGGVKTLHRKICTCVEKINEVIDEIRMELVDCD